MSEENSNFHQLLNLRAQENPEIIEWLQKRDEKYASPEIQNELLEGMALGMMWQIFPNIQNATFFMIMADQEIMIFWADETEDVSNMEQLVICIRWVDDNLVPRAFYRRGRGGAGKGPRWPEGRPEVTTDLAPRVFSAPHPHGGEKKDLGNEVEFTPSNGGSFPEDYSWIANANSTSRRKTRHKSASTN